MVPHDPTKVNDMHLIPVSPNKAVKEWFHIFISCGLCWKKDDCLSPSVWVFQCVVSVVVQFFFFFHYLFANTLSACRDGTFPVDFLFFKQPHGRRHYSIYSRYNVNWHGCNNVSLRFLHYTFLWVQLSRDSASIYRLHMEMFGELTNGTENSETEKMCQLGLKSRTKNRCL